MEEAPGLSPAGLPGRQSKANVDTELDVPKDPPKMGAKGGELDVLLKEPGLHKVILELYRGLRHVAILILSLDT